MTEVKFESHSKTGNYFVSEMWPPHKHYTNTYADIWIKRHSFLYLAKLIKGFVWFIFDFIVFMLVNAPIFAWPTEKALTNLFQIGEKDNLNKP